MSVEGGGRDEGEEGVRGREGESSMSDCVEGGGWIKGLRVGSFLEVNARMYEHDMSQG